MNAKHMLMTAVSFVCMALCAGVTEKDWCRIETPDSWNEGEPFPVKITTKNIPSGQQVCCHLQWTKQAGWGGNLAWAPGKDAKSGGTYTFNHKPGMKPEMAGINCLVFLAPGGDFNKCTKRADVGVKVGGKGGKPSGGKKQAQQPKGSNYSEKPASVTYKKSYIWLEEAAKPTRAGESLTLRIHYYLDPSDTWGPKPTQMMCMPLGPWIDNPDGEVNKKRHHVGYQGLWPQHKPVETGDHVIEFSWKLEKTFRYNGCSFLCKFKTPAGGDWPWEWRGGGMQVIKESDTFFLEPTALGGLFKYGETPVVKIGWGKKPAAGPRQAKVTVKNVTGKVVLTKTITVDSSRKSEEFKLDGLHERGTFSVTVDVPDVGSDYCYFGTIPEFKRESGRRTPFGVTNMHDEELVEIASELGFSYTRLFQSWNGLQPAPKIWMLDNLDNTIKINNKHGLQPWICLFGPPAWALPEGMWGAGYEPSPFSLEGWSALIDKLARRYKGQLYGFEMLNEIVPGNKCKDPVKEYVAICRTGYKAAKAVDPNLVIQLAGGLWPHNYRIDLLNAGVGEWIDVLPAHYSTYDGVMEVREDLAVRGIRKVRAADNETASGMSTWNMTPEQTLSKSIAQCRHVMTRWPDELCAGALFITYFGGTGDPCGNWSYMIDRKSPRPCAVTLGVVQGKIGYAKAVGKFFMGDLPVQLFERDGRAIAFVCSPGKDGVQLAMPAKGALLVTDYQGNEKKVSGGKVTAGDMPVIVEGLDLDAMKLHAVLRIGTSRIPAAEPQVVVDASEKMAIPVGVRNPYPDTRTFTLTPSAAEWGSAAPVTLTLKPRESKKLELFYSPAGGKKVSALSKLTVTVSTKGVPSVAKPFLLYAIDPDSIGNLLKNGDFDDGKSAPWGGSGKVVDSPDGSGKSLLFTGGGPGKWRSQSQNVSIPVPGQSYLYTCWMWGQGQGGGSNIGEHFSDGTKSKSYYAPHVFSMGAKGSTGWRLMVKRFDSHANTSGLSLTPLCDGNGRTYVDNISFSLYKGTDYVAFAGKKGGEKKSSKIPLCCDNQIQSSGGYTWSPKNLSGIAEFEWAPDGLTLHCAVTDDVSAPKAITSSGSQGDEALKGDMLALAIFPKIGPDGRPESSQIRWYMNLASPGGGSGATTLFRPSKYSLGMKSGQLAKDSSVYQVNFRREGGKTVYDLKIPWSEIPGFSPAKGASFGCNLVLIDVDKGGGSGKMIWGSDLGDSASGCGIVTLLP